MKHAKTYNYYPARKDPALQVRIAMLMLTPDAVTGGAAEDDSAHTD
jgi:hypothetical protein